jgi:hypothetical protein
MRSGGADTPSRCFRHPAGSIPRLATRPAETGCPATFQRKEATMVPILLWILGVPGLIIILLLLFGIIHI